MQAELARQFLAVAREGAAIDLPGFAGVGRGPILGSKTAAWMSGGKADAAACPDQA